MAHLTNFSFEFFYEIFTENASLLCLDHGPKKSKMTKNSNQGGGPALKAFYLIFVCSNCKKSGLSNSLIVSTHPFFAFREQKRVISPTKKTPVFSSRVTRSTFNTATWKAFVWSRFHAAILAMTNKTFGQRGEHRILRHTKRNFCRNLDKKIDPLWTAPDVFLVDVYRRTRHYSSSLTITTEKSAFY